jgi:hypothetical protein
MSTPLGEVETPERIVEAPDPRLGLRVTRGEVVEGEEAGEATSIITIAGVGQEMARKVFNMAGQGVQIATANNGRKAFGRVKRIVVDAPRDKPLTVKAKVEGARELDGFVGNQVAVSKRQGELPGIGKSDPAATEEQLRSLRPKDGSDMVNPPRKGRPRRRGKGGEARA